MTATIELDDLHVQLGGRTILDGLSGALNGRAIGLLGPNGAGKSTLINTLLGFHPPDVERLACSAWTFARMRASCALRWDTCRRAIRSSPG